MTTVITLFGPPVMVGLLGLIIRWELTERRGQWGTPDDIGGLLADREYERRSAREADMDDDPRDGS